MATSPSDIVQVENIGRKSVTFAWGGVKQIVRPGETRAVPAQGVKLALGDWDLHDDVDNDFTPRSSNRERLATKYGLCGDPFYSDDLLETMAGADEVNKAGRVIAPPRPYTPVELIDGRRAYLHPNLPQVKVSDLNGNRIITIVDDPDGVIESGKAQREMDRDDNAVMRAQVKALQEQQQQLIAALAVSNPGLAAELATSTNDPTRPDLPSVHDDPDAPDDSAGEIQTAGVAAENAMDVMNQELGLTDADDDDEDDDDDSTTPAPRPVKKAAAKKAAARKDDA